LTLNIGSDGEFDSNGNFQLVWQIHPVQELPQDYQQQTSRCEAWLDADTLPDVITVRGFQPGDRIKPMGMGGRSIKVSDLMMNEKVIRYARAKYLILDSVVGIFWIPALRVSDFCKITAETRRVIHFSCRVNLGLDDADTGSISSTTKNA
jgi:tRNA(Ile)-lysidine synthase